MSFKEDWQIEEPAKSGPRLSGNAAKLEQWKQERIDAHDRMIRLVHGKLQPGDETLSKEMKKRIRRTLQGGGWS